MGQMSDVKRDNVKRDVSHRLQAQHPGRLPVIVRHAGNLAGIPEVSKFMVRKNCQWAAFVGLFRSKLSLKSTEGLIFFIDKLLPSPQATISEIYDMYADAAGIIQCHVSIENTFG